MAQAAYRRCSASCFTFCLYQGEKIFREGAFLRPDLCKFLLKEVCLSARLTKAGLIPRRKFSPHGLNIALSEGKTSLSADGRGVS